MTIEINWWMLSPLAAICLTALAYQRSKSLGLTHGRDLVVFLIMILTLIFTARLLP